MKSKELNAYMCSRLAVPLGFNTACNRFREQIRCISVCSAFDACFYEYHGLYWYSLKVQPFEREINSIPFLSMRQCISCFRHEMCDYGFRFSDKSAALRSIACLCKEGSPKIPSTNWRS